MATLVPRATAVIRNVGARVAELRRQRGLTQEALAGRIHSNDKHVQRIEAGLENLTLKTIDGIAAALETTAPELLKAPTTVTRRVGRPPKPPAVVSFPTARVRPSTVFSSAVPLLTLISRDGDPDVTSGTELLDWVEMPGRKVKAGTFVLRIQGTALTPTVQDGGLLVMRSGTPNDLDGKTLLIETLENGGAESRYMLKTVRVVEKKANGDVKVRLESLNPSIRPRTLVLSADGPSRAIAELVDIPTV